MGTSFRIVLYAASRTQADPAAAAAYARIDELEQALSDWNTHSELCCAIRAASAAPGTAVAISPDLTRVLARAQEVAAASHGAFDPTIGACVALWRRSRRRGELPAPDALAAALAATGHAKLHVDPMARTLTARVPGMALDLGGIAKGDALDEALAVLRRHGIERALIDGGGDVLAAAPPPGTTGWTVGLAELALDPDRPPPVAFAVLLADAALATSGDTYRAVEIDGLRYSHILDPRTGLGLTRRILVAALAPDGATADALATAISVGGAGSAPALLATFPGSAARIVERAPEGVATCTFGRWPPMMPAPVDAPAAPDDSSALTTEATDGSAGTAP